MKLSILSKVLLGLLLSLGLSVSSLYAQARDYYSQDKNQWVMPASSSNLQPAYINWEEVRVNNQISWIRGMETSFKAMFNQEMVGGSSGGVAASKTASVSSKTPQAPSKTIQDKALASLVTTELAKDKTLTYNDMLAVFTEVAFDNVVSAAEFAGLQTMIAYPTLYPIVSSVQYLSNAVVNGSAWNATYQGRSLGNLTSGSKGTQLQSLVNKWFLGMDNPTAVDDYGTKYSYKLASGSLFVNGPSYTDIDQGYVGDCWLMASFAETALRDTKIISNMFTDNGNNTYTVKLFNNGVANYVTVDKQLPVDSSGLFGFADVGASYTNVNNELWTALAEKAVVEEQASLGYKNAYSSIDGGYIGVGLGDITGHAYTVGNSLATTRSYNGFNLAVAAWNSGALMGFASKSSHTNLGVVSGHAYAVVGYNSITSQFTLFNPWGINNGFAPGLLTLSWSQIQSNFSYYDTAVA